jgi:hypothetical protein
MVLLQVLGAALYELAFALLQPVAFVVAAPHAFVPETKLAADHRLGSCVASARTPAWIEHESKALNATV